MGGPYEGKREVLDIKGFSTPENVVLPNDIDSDLLIKCLDKLHKYISGDSKQVKLIVTSNIFNNKIKDEVLEVYSKKYKAIYVYMNDR